MRFDHDSISLGAYVGITAEARDGWEASLQATARDHETAVYDGAPHSVSDRTAEGCTGQSADASQFTLESIPARTEG